MEQPKANRPVAVRGCHVHLLILIHLSLSISQSTFNAHHHPNCKSSRLLFAPLHSPSTNFIQTRNHDLSIRNEIRDRANGNLFKRPNSFDLLIDCVMINWY